MAWIDVSVPLRTGMVVYEGDPEVAIEPVTRIAAGDLANVSRMALGTHSGTHMDAPRHFIDGAPGVDRIPLDALVGPAIVADARGAPGDIDAAALAALDLPSGTERLLLRTRNEALRERDAFTRGFVGIADDAARELAAMGVRLVGIDYLSIAPSAEPSPTHLALLEAGVAVVENLDLRRAPPGAYELVCLPLRVEGADGAPARALLRPAEELRSGTAGAG
jgi:arylformamidase